MLRNIVGLLAGIVAGILVQAGVIYLASLFLDVPVVRSAARQEMAQAFAAAPSPALIATILSYLAAGFAAAWIAARISGSPALAWAAGGVIAFMALVIAIIFPDPAWAQFGAFAAALAGTMLGKHAALDGQRTGRDPAASAAADG